MNKQRLEKLSKGDDIAFYATKVAYGTKLPTENLLVLEKWQTIQ